MLEIAIFQFPLKASDFLLNRRQFAVLFLDLVFQGLLSGEVVVAAGFQVFYLVDVDVPLVFSKVPLDLADVLHGPLYLTVEVLLEGAKFLKFLHHFTHVT